MIKSKVIIKQLKKSKSKLIVAMLFCLTQAIYANVGNSQIVPPPQQDPEVLALASSLFLPEGNCYQTTAPDTLDLAERCRLATHGLTWSVSDTEYDHEPYCSIIYNAVSPYGSFNNGIGLTASPKYAEALPMVRLASGSQEGLDIEESFMRAYLARISPEDGLQYATRITPFTKKDRPWHNDCYPVPEGGKRIKDEDMADAYYQGRNILALMAWYERSGNKNWLPLIEKCVRGLEKMAIQKEDYAYFPDGLCGQPYNRPRSGWSKTSEATKEDEGGEGSMFMYHGGQIRALARYYKLTGDKQALEMARKISRYVLKARFWGDCPSSQAPKLDPQDRDKVVFEIYKTDDTIGRADGYWYGHCHGRTSVLRGLLELAEADNDKRLMEFVKSSYEYGVRHLSTRSDEGRGEWKRPGVELYPRVLGAARGGAFGETCTIADMIALALRLTEDGMGDYHDDVDRWVRNHLVERQFVDGSLLAKVSEKPDPNTNPSSVVYKDELVTKNVIEGSLGLFAIFSHLNRMKFEFPPKNNPLVNSLVCCSCNGSQALYYVWDSIVRKKNEWVEINFLLNRASPWLDVDSYLPYEGKLVIRNKTAQNVRVRLSDWILPYSLKATINEKNAPVIRNGKFIEFTNLQPKDIMVIKYPVPETVEQIGEYTCTFRGTTLCKVEPQAADYDYPLYQREKYLNNQAPMITVERYVTLRTLTW